MHLELEKVIRARNIQEIAVPANSQGKKVTLALLPLLLHDSHARPSTYLFSTPATTRHGHLMIPYACHIPSFGDEIDRNLSLRFCYTSF